MGNICSNRLNKSEFIQKEQTPYNSHRPLKDEHYTSLNKDAVLLNDNQLNQEESQQIQVIQKELIYANSHNDVQTIIKYLDSELRLQTPYNYHHPWGKPLTTIGAMATLYLAILLTKDIVKNQDGFSQQEQMIAKNLNLMKIQKTNLIIAKNLKNKESNMQQITILLLNTLSEEPDYFQELLDTDIFDQLMTFLDLKNNQVLGQRASCLCILTNLFKNKPQLSKKFYNNPKVMEYLQYFFEFELQEHVIIGLTALDDILQDNAQQNSVNIESCKKFVEYGFIDILKKLKYKIELQLKDQNANLDASFQETLNMTLKLTIFLIQRLQLVKQSS